MNEKSDREQKAYEARLQRRLSILKEQFEAGKVTIAPGLKVIDSLKRVRYAPDGTVDLSTVDALVRSLALGVEAFHDREEMKRSASLAEIQNAYFTFIENNFGQFYKVMRERKLTPHDAGVALSRTPQVVAEVNKGLSDFFPALQEFWESAGPIAIAHVEDARESLKAVFGGDLFPALENIASKCGVYTDTIVLPDPFLRSRHIFQLSDDDEQKAYYVIKHGLNLLQYKDLACADITPPIVVVLPDTSIIHEGEHEFFLGLGKDDALIHASHLFGRQFGSFDELSDFCEKLDTIERVVANVKDKERLLFDTEWPRDAAEQLRRAIQAPEFKLLGTVNPGIIVASQAVGRMAISNELLIKSRRLAGTPVIDAPTSWQYFTWKLEYDAAATEEKESLRDLHVVRGLQALAENEMRWLGKVPVDALIELRKTGALGEVRGILNKGVQSLAEARPSNFYRTTDLVFENLNAAFSEHQRNIDALTAKKWKFAGSDIGSWLVVGSLAVAAAATGQPVWALSAIAADQVLRAPKLRDIPQSIKALAAETTKLRRSPVGMLFKLRNPKG